MPNPGPHGAPNWLHHTPTNPLQTMQTTTDIAAARAIWHAITDQCTPARAAELRAELADILACYAMGVEMAKHGEVDLVAGPLPPTQTTLNRAALVNAMAAELENYMP